VGVAVCAFYSPQVPVAPCGFRSRSRTFSPKSETFLAMSARVTSPRAGAISKPTPTPTPTPISNAPTLLAGGDRATLLLPDLALGRGTPKLARTATLNRAVAQLLPVCPEASPFSFDLRRIGHGSSENCGHERTATPSASRTAPAPVS
jgi:hypothetical protein